MYSSFSSAASSSSLSSSCSLYSSLSRSSRLLHQYQWIPPSTRTFPIPFPFTSAMKAPWILSPSLSLPFPPFSPFSSLSNPTQRPSSSSFSGPNNIHNNSNRNSIGNGNGNGNGNGKGNGSMQQQNQNYQNNYNDHNNNNNNNNNTNNLMNNPPSSWSSSSSSFSPPPSPPSRPPPLPRPSSHSDSKSNSSPRSHIWIHRLMTLGCLVLCIAFVRYNWKIFSRIATYGIYDTVELPNFIPYFNSKLSIPSPKDNNINISPSSPPPIPNPSSLPHSLTSHPLYIAASSPSSDTGLLQFLADNSDYPLEDIENYISLCLSHVDDPNCQYSLNIFSKWGQIVPCNKNIAAEWEDISITNGHPQAIWDKGNAMLISAIVKQKEINGLNFFSRTDLNRLFNITEKHFSDADSMITINPLSPIFINLPSCEHPDKLNALSDEPKRMAIEAMKYFEKLSLAGNLKSTEIFNILEYQLSVANTFQNTAEYVKYLQQCEENKDNPRDGDGLSLSPISLESNLNSEFESFRLGIYHLLGVGCKQNAEKGLQILRTAVSETQSVEAVDIARTSSTETVSGSKGKFPTDDQLSWFQVGVRLGSVLSLGLDTEKGLTIDPSKSNVRYELLFERLQGRERSSAFSSSPSDTKVMEMLGLYYYYGIFPVEKSEERAKEYFTQCAKKGRKHCQVRMSLWYSENHSDTDKDTHTHTKGDSEEERKQKEKNDLESKKWLSIAQRNPVNSSRSPLNIHPQYFVQSPMWLNHQYHRGHTLQLSMRIKTMNPIKILDVTEPSPRVNAAMKNWEKRTAHQ